MKLAVTYENGAIFQHFGHTETVKIYTVENGKVGASEVIGTEGHGHGALAAFLKEKGVAALICGGLGGGAFPPEGGGGGGLLRGGSPRGASCIGMRV